MPGTAKPSGLVQGTLDMLILKTLALEPMHGYGIGVRIEQISKGVFQVNAGSLFPGLPPPGAGRADQRRVGSHRKQSPREVLPPHRARARQAQTQAREDWEVQTTAIARILRASLGEL